MERKHTVGLTGSSCPTRCWQEVLYLIEPIIVTTISRSERSTYHSPWTLVTAMVIISLYVIVNILGTVHLSRKDKLVLSLMSPLMYVFFYLLSVVEYIALVQSVIRLPKLRKSISEEKVTWKSPERVAA